MKTIVFDGIKAAGRIKKKIKIEVAEVKSILKRVPKLVSVMVGNDYGSGVYLKMQKKESENIGIDFESVKLQSGITQEELISKIEVLNNDSVVDGIFMHQPLPDEISVSRIRKSIAEDKDVECEHPVNLGKLFNSDISLVPPTPAAILFAIKESGVELKGKEVVVIGHSNIVGKPIALLLLNEFATVTVAHIGTYEANNLYQHMKRADILISATGENNLVKGDYIKEGAVVIDVGICNRKNGIGGDVAHEQVLGKANFVTPVPGGIGPLTVAFLMKNLITLCKKNYGRKK